MSRLQLAINVDDLDTAIEFYSKMFKTEPARVRPGYANFAIADPPLKLVLFDDGVGNSLNHLGVEVESADDVERAEARLAADGLDTTGIDDTACCFATKTETWVTAPDGERLEWYVRTGDSEQLDNTVLNNTALANAAGASTTCCP